MENLTPCKFYIKGSDTPLTYNQMREYLAQNNIVEPIAPLSPLKTRAAAIRERADRYRTGGTLQALPNAIATALDVYASILETADNINEAIKKFRATNEYKALNEEERNEVDELLAEDEVEFSMEAEMIERNLEDAATGEEGVKSFIANVQKAEALSPKEKKKVNDAIAATYSVLTEEDLDKYGAAIVEAYGGLQKAIKEAMKPDSKMVSAVRIYVMAQAIKDAKERRAKAKTQAEQDEISDEQIQYFNFVDEFGRGLGRAVNAIKLVYALDNLAVVRDVKNKAERHNKIYNPTATKDAKEIVRVIEEEGDVAEAMEKAAEAENQTTISARIKELEEELKKVKATKDAATRKKTTRKPRFTDADLAKARKDLLGGLSANPFLDPKKWQAISTIAAYYMERGYYAFEDFYKKIRKDLKGEYEEYYADVYNSVKQNLIEQGVSEKEFDNDDIVQKTAEELFQREAKLEAELENKKKEKQLFTLMSERVKTEKKTPTPKKEKILALAKELDEKNNTDQYTKQAESYLANSVSPNELLKQALIDAGFSKEVTDPKTGKKVTRVDWRAVSADSKNVEDTVAKIEKALKDRLPKEQLDIILASLKAKAEALIVEQKRKAVTNLINSKNRTKAARVSKALKRNKTEIEKLLTLWKQGGLTDGAVKDILAEELGIITITPEIEKEIERRLNDIDAAQEGAEREKLEEDFQAYIDYLGLNEVSLAFFDRMRMRLFGAFTLLKNLTGATVASTMAASLIIRNNLPILTGKGGDKYIPKIAAIAARKSIAVMGDMLMNGGVDLGSAFSETTNTKEGTPRIRYGEYTYRRKWYNKPVNVMGKNLNLYNWFYDREKYVSRFMSASDAFSHIILMELKAFDEMKHTLRKNNPTMSNSEASAKAFEIMYGDSFAEANAKALEEFRSRGIEFDFNKASDRARFKRRVFEIVQQKRDVAVQKASILFANIHTFKAADYGVSTLGAAAVRAIKTGLYSIANKIEADSRKKSPDNVESKTAKRAAKVIKYTTEAAFVKFLPFVNGVANIMEKGFELTPYGVLKGGAQAGYVAVAGESDTYTYRRAFDTTFRGVLGTSLLTIIAGMLIDDEDEDGIPDLFGEGPTDPAMRAVANSAHQTNTIRISGYSIPLDYLGTLGIPLKILGNYYDSKRYKEELPDDVASGLAYAGGIALNSMNDLYLEQLTTAIKQAKGSDPSKFLEAQTSELVTRMTVPFIASFRQAGTIAYPTATVPIGLADNMKKYLGVFSGWAIDRPNFDYRGNEYKVGEKYTGSPDGLVRSFMKTNPTDDVDLFVLKYSPRLPYQKQSDFKVPFDMLGAASDVVSDEEFYELKYNTAKNFGELLELYYATNPEDKQYQIKAFTEETIIKAAEKAAKNLLEQEGVPVDLESKSYLEKLEKKMDEVRLMEGKNEKIKKNINQLFEAAEAAAMYDLIERLGATHKIGTLDDKREYEALLEELKGMK